MIVKEKLKLLLIMQLYVFIASRSFSQTNNLLPETIDSANESIKKNTYRLNLNFPVVTVGDTREGI